MHEGVEVSEPTLPASVEASEGLPLPSEDKTKKAPARKGRVVGIIRRNWRQLAGSLDLTRLPATTALAEDATTVFFRPKELKLPPMLLTTRRAEVFPLATVRILLSHCFQFVSIICW